VESAIFEGVVRHVRHEPVRHAFRQRIALLYLDLAELDEVGRVSRLLGVERRALASFRRADHFGAGDAPLDATVRALVEARVGRRPEGPIRVLTQPRVLGHVFNPLTLWLCATRDGRGLDALVAEVTNTPWLERHCYVLDLAGAHEARCGKRLHVSPFMGMDQEYTFRFHGPDARFELGIESREAGRRVFDAGLALERRELSPATLRRTLASGALAPARAVAAIHWQALRLWWKGAPFHAHPRHAAASVQERAA
jgi:DUF1365 family protein